MIAYVKMAECHVEQIAELEKICFSDPWSVNSIRYELTNPLSTWFVAIDGDRVVGYIGSQAVLDEADIMNVAVDPAYRRQGVAQGLIDNLIEELKKRDVVCLFLEVRVSNESAINLYDKNGFLQVGLRKNYYHNPKEDALILRKEWKQ